MKRIGPKVDRRGTPERITNELDVVNATLTWKVLEVNSLQSVSSYSIFLKFVDERLIWDLVESFCEVEDK